MLAFERGRQLDTAEATAQVLLVLTPDTLEMVASAGPVRAGKSVTRSLLPFPLRTVISPRSKSTSLPRRWQHSSSRSPAP